MPRSLTRRLALLLVAACSPDPTTDLDGVSDTAATCGDDDDCPPGVRCDTELGMCLLQDDDSADAPTPLAFRAPLTGRIFPAGDQDFYAFTTDSPGQWIFVETRGTDDSDLDTVVRLYDPDGEEHAWADGLDRYRLLEVDSRVMAYLPVAGTWTVRVEDRSQAFPDEYPSARGGRDFSYELELASFASATNETATTQVELASGTQVAARGVLLQEAGDIDTIELTTPFAGTLEISGGMRIPGSEAELKVEVLQGTRLHARQDQMAEDRFVQLWRADQGTYSVEISDRRASGSQDHWAILYMRTYDPGAPISVFGDQPFERETESNNTWASADDPATIEATASDNRAYVASFVEGTVSNGADDDWYRVVVGPGQDRISVICATERYGSVVDLAFELQNPQGTRIVGIGGAGELTTPIVYDVDVGADATYRLRVFPQAGPYGDAAYYRCQILRTDWDIVP